jgi:hypothetical protein
MRFIVNGLPLVGTAVHRAGRRWPKEGTLVEVVDASQEHPIGTKVPEGEPLKISKNTWEALKADKVLIRIVPEGDVEDVAAMKAEIVRLKARIEELEGAQAPASSKRGGK